MTVEIYPITVANYHFAFPLDKAVKRAEFMATEEGVNLFEALSEEWRLLVATRGLPNLAVVHAETASFREFGTWYSVWNTADRQILGKEPPKLLELCSAFKQFLLRN